MLYVCPIGSEDWLAQELRRFGAKQIRLGRAQVRTFDPARPDEGGIDGLRVALRTCLQSRLASRVLWPFADYEASTPESLYAGAASFRFETMLREQDTFAVHCRRGEGELSHTTYVAQVIKDAIVDRFRGIGRPRPDVDRQNPAALLHVFLRGGRVTLAFDLAGESLHRRGYRREPGLAPLQETLAAAVLCRAGWPAAAIRGEPLLDPMCGSGTLLCEGAALARGLPGNAERRRFGAEGLASLPAELWRDERARARAAHASAMAARAPAPIVGLDADPAQLARAAAALARLGLVGDVRLIGKAVEQSRPSCHGLTGPGLVVTNPPYGERLAASPADMQIMLGALGDSLRAHPGWQASVLVAERAHGYAIGLRAHRVWQLVHGGLPILQLQFKLRDEARPSSSSAAPLASAKPQETRTAAVADSPQSEFAGRLAKVARRWCKRAVKEGWGAARIYDADLPNYAAAIDWYQAIDNKTWVYLQEYKPPAEVPTAKAEARLRHMVVTTARTLGIPPAQLVIHTRRRQRPTVAGSHYAQRSETPRSFWLDEQGALFKVSLDAYVDTGLYLDHRLLRAHFAKHARGRSLLNLFGYTGSMTVAAARGGASFSTTVDKSATYLDWASQNFSANRLGERHRLVRADVMAYLHDATSQRERYDIIFVGPPTFSNTRGRTADFEVSRDHAALISLAMARLSKGGELWFSTHKRKFELSPEVIDAYRVNDLTAKYCPADFARHRPHRLWRLVHQTPT